MVCPLTLLRHTTSARPSALRSPLVLISQFTSAIVARNADLDTAAPFISQPTFCPDTLFRRRTSALPSPSRSPTALISQFVSAIVGRNAELTTVRPFISQATF